MSLKSQVCRKPSSGKNNSFRPRLETMEDRCTPAGLFIFGADTGGGPHLKAFDIGTGEEARSIFAYDPEFRGGIRVGWGDITGDGTPDAVTAPGPGGGPHIKVFDGVTFQEVQSYFAYDPSFTGGVSVSVGDINGDTFVDIITGAGPGGGPHVKAFSGRDGSELLSFFAYESTFLGGVNVNAGNIDGVGVHEIVTGPWQGGGPHVKVFNAETLAEQRSFFAYQPDFSGGVWVAVGDVTGDGQEDIVTAPGTGAGNVKVFDAVSGQLVSEFQAADPEFTGGIRAGSRGDINNDGHNDILTVFGPGSPPSATVWDGASMGNGGTGEQPEKLREFSVFDDDFSGGVFTSLGKMIIEFPVKGTPIPI